ncbi:YqxA family protein [Bacillus sp. SCS-151]|uniref:YqxA family protein n=1 Tax=Nanhaiella sioensis TaxID=3115293 RepID=UPI00397A433B
MKCFLLCTVLLFGVLIGMQKANSGIIEMKGYDDPSFRGALEIVETSNGEFEASVLGLEATSHDLKQKQQQLAEIKAFNLFSSMGKTIAEAVSNTFQKILQMIDTLFAKIMEGKSR